MIGPASSPATEPVSGLEAGAFLLFEEVRGANTGEEGDADPTHRHVVRLTEAVETNDPLDGTAVVEISWDAADALPFAICISARADEAHGFVPIEKHFVYALGACRVT